MDIVEDVLFGVEVWMTLFPNFEGEGCLCKPSSITTPPTQVKYHKPAHVCRIVVTEPTSDNASSSSKSSKDEVEAIVFDQVIESDLLEIGSADLDEQEVCRMFTMHSIDEQSSSSSSATSSNQQH